MLPENAFGSLCVLATLLESAVIGYAMVLVGLLTLFHVVPREPAQSPSPFFLTRITLYFQSSVISASSGFVDNWRQPEHWFRFALVLAELIGTASGGSLIAC